MAFSSPEVLFLFMPVFFTVYYATRPRYRNLLILTASLIFYAVAAGYVTLILVASIVANHVIARAIGAQTAAKRLLLTVGVVCNVAPLRFYKYTSFLLRTTRDTLAHVGVPEHIAVLQFLLPIGISFYTFRVISWTFMKARYGPRPPRSISACIWRTSPVDRRTDRAVCGDRRLGPGTPDQR